MMNPDPDLSAEKRDPLWNLLGRASRPEADPWFAARTLARCRQARAASRRLRLAWRSILGASVGVSLTLLLIATNHPAPSVPSHQGVQEAFEIIASMDTDNSDSSSWQDSSL